MRALVFALAAVILGAFALSAFNGSLTWEMIRDELLIWWATEVSNS